MDKIEDKCPRDIKGRTPFHSAADNGHFEVCQLFLNELEDKNKDINPNV